MRLIVDFRGVLDEQHTLRLAHRRPRLPHMWLDQLLIADLRCLQEAVSCVRLPLAAHLLGQGGARIGCHGRRHAHRSLLAPPMAQVHFSKGLLGPLLGRQQRRCLHHPLRACSLSALFTPRVDILSPLSL